MIDRVQLLPSHSVCVCDLLWLHFLSVHLSLLFSPFTLSSQHGSRPVCQCWHWQHHTAIPLVAHSMQVSCIICLYSRFLAKRQAPCVGMRLSLDK